LILVVATAPTGGAPAACQIAEGVGIGAVRLGMTVPAALAAAGHAAEATTSGTEVVYDLPSPWLAIVADYGFVQRVATRSPECQTTRGIAVGALAAAVREAYLGATVIVTTPAREGSYLSYPFLGIRFHLRNNQVDAIEVFYPIGVTRVPPAPEATPGPRPSPGATPAAGIWGVRSTTVRFDDAEFVVSGTVENRGQARAAYAEVAALDAAGRRIGQGNAPLVPTLVPSGGASTFEVRLTVTDIVRRYTVAIRPAAGGPALAESTGEVRNLALFGPVVAKQLQVRVQATSATPSRTGFVVVVTNASSLPVASATVTVEISTTCRFGVTPRFAQETWTATVTIQSLAPGASVQSPLTLSGGLCEGIAVEWAASTRVGEVKIRE
jgi:hypothetical protein